MSVEDRRGRDAGGRRAQALLDAVARAGRGARDRVEAAVEELRRPGGWRLSDLERTMARRMLDGLVGAIETELRTALLAHPELRASAEFRESIASERVAIALPILERAGLLHDRDLVALLLRRVDEYRLGAALRARAEPPPGDALDALPAHPDTEVAEAAMAVLVAESRGNDRFDDSALAPADLSADVRHRLTWRTAAALRSYAETEHGLDPARFDAVAAPIVAAVLAAHDEGARLEAAALRLARLLEAASALHDGVLVEAVSRGRVALYVAALAARAGVEPDPAWDAVTGADQSGHAVLLRAIDADEDAAARLLAMMADAHAGHEAGEHTAWLVEASRALDADDARGAIGAWRLDADYRATLGLLADAR